MYLLAGKKYLYNLNKYSKEKYPLRIIEKGQLIKILLQKNGNRSPSNLIDNMDKDESDKDI